MSQRATQAWYISRNGEASGPFATELVRAMLKEGQLQPLDLVFREGEPEWRPARSFRELKSGGGSTLVTDSVGELFKDSEDLKGEAHTGVAHGKTPGWIVLKTHNSTYLQDGPYSTQTILEGLRKGDFQYSQYAWHAGMTQWMRIGDLREFDRRSKARENMPHVPPPLPDPVEVVLLENDSDADAEEFHVAMRSGAGFDFTPPPIDVGRDLNVTQLGSAAIGGAAADSPEERASEAVSLVVSTPNLASVPWEQEGFEHSGVFAKSVELSDDDEGDEYGMKEFVAHSAPPGAPEVYSDEYPDPLMEAAINRTPTPVHQGVNQPFVPAPVANVEYRDSWMKWGRFAAGGVLLALIGVFALHLATHEESALVRSVGPEAVEQKAVSSSEPKVAEATNTGEVVAEKSAVETSSASGTPANVEPVGGVLESVSSVSGPPAPTAADSSAGYKITGIKLDAKPEAVERGEGEIAIHGPIAAKTAIQVSFKGRLGQVLSKFNVRKTVSLEKKDGETPTLRLKDLKLPAGAYTVEVEIGADGAKKSLVKDEVFIGARDARFLDRLEVHLREISLETQSQKKALFYAAQEMDILARDLGLNYGQLRAKPAMWSSFMTRWKKRVETLGRQISGIEKKGSDAQAYPEETDALAQALRRLNEVAGQFEAGVQQKRDIASDTLSDLISELARQKKTIGEATARPTANTPDGVL